MRPIAFALTLVFGLNTAALAATPVVLKPAPASHGASVTLGDLFDGVDGPAAQVAVARAVPAGGDTVLEAGRVQLAARAAGLVWDNPAGQRRVIVASLGGAAPPRAQVAKARAAARSGQVLAWARNVNAGEIVQAADLVWSAEAVAGADAVSDTDQVIGKAARRALRAGTAAALHDLAAPRVIKREDPVTVAFEQDGVSLTLQGKALADAGMGDVVQVQNPQSKKIIEAIASGPGRAVVGPEADRLRAAPFATASR